VGRPWEMQGGGSLAPLFVRRARAADHALQAFQDRIEGPAGDQFFGGACTNRRPGSRPAEIRARAQARRRADRTGHGLPGPAAGTPNRPTREKRTQKDAAGLYPPPRGPCRWPPQPGDGARGEPARGVRRTKAQRQVTVSGVRGRRVEVVGGRRAGGCWRHAGGGLVRACCGRRKIQRERRVAEHGRRPPRPAA